MFGSKDLVGLDIGTHSIKLVRLKKGKKGFELLNFGIMPLPPETIVDETIEKPEVVANAIKNLFKMEKISTKEVVTAVSGQSLVIKKINVPKMTEDELAESIKVEAEQYLPFALEEVDMGDSFTNVNILVDGVTEVTRDIPGGGNRINHELQKNFNTDHKGAEKLKMGIGLNGVSEKDVANTITTVLGELSHEINKMFHN